MRNRPSRSRGHLLTVLVTRCVAQGKRLPFCLKAQRAGTRKKARAAGGPPRGAWAGRPRLEQRPRVPAGGHLPHGWHLLHPDKLPPPPALAAPAQRPREPLLQGEAPQAPGRAHLDGSTVTFSFFKKQKYIFIVRGFSSIPPFFLTQSEIRIRRFAGRGEGFFPGGTGGKRSAPSSAIRPAERGRGEAGALFFLERKAQNPAGRRQAPPPPW